ncbi:hypothetical protein JKP88DRAFT_284396 [Tribonema minus]|uniref:TRAF-type domain-containing protein n=1 Tax=Tribonema minus TaxID=303371 RepID=A0A835ZJU0_9STRA|nr:hypothetical protein JKP88DRAFT_284396 [Tribonema minus]
MKPLQSYQPALLLRCKGGVVGGVRRRSSVAAAEWRSARARRSRAPLDLPFVGASSAAALNGSCAVKLHALQTAQRPKVPLLPQRSVVLLTVQCAYRHCRARRSAAPDPGARRATAWSLALRRLSQQRRRLRGAQRLPLAEALYNGKPVRKPLQTWARRRETAALREQQASADAQTVSATEVFDDDGTVVHKIVQRGHGFANAAKVWLRPLPPPPAAIPPAAVAQVLHTGMSTKSGSSTHSTAPVGDGPGMDLIEVAALGAAERGCKGFHPGAGWFHEGDSRNEWVECKALANKLQRELQVLEEMGRRERARRAAARRSAALAAVLRHAMDAAIAEGNYCHAMELCSRGADPDHETPDGETLLMRVAEMEGDAGVAALRDMLSRGTHRPALDHEGAVRGHTALTWAADIACVLLQRGALIDRPAGAAARAPLAAAAAAGRAAVVRLLLERGADAAARDASGATPLDLARARGFHDVVALLSAAAATAAAAAAAEPGADLAALVSEAPSSAAASLTTASASALALVPLRGGDDSASGSNPYTSQRTAAAAGGGSGDASAAVAAAGEMPGATRPPMIRVPGEAVAAYGEAPPRRPCAHGCGALSAEGDGHAERCAQRPVRCALGCGAELRAADADAHAANACAARRARCAACEEEVAGGALEAHRARECRARAVACGGCGARVAAMFYERHCRDACPRRPQECPLRCGAAALAARDVAAHVQHHCRLRKVKCDLGCGQFMSLELHAEHMAEHCRERLVPCAACPARVRAKHMPAHEANELHMRERCPRRWVPCVRACGRSARAEDAAADGGACAQCALRQCSACGERVAAAAMQAHQQHGCSERTAPCALCGDAVPLSRRAAHRDDECRERLVRCRFTACSMEVAFKDLERHGAEACACRRVACLQGCGAEMEARHLRRHSTRECPMRLLDCPRGCGKRVRACEADAHVRSLCIRRHAL